MKLRNLLAALLLLAPSLHAEEATAHFPKTGFSISPLDSAPTDAPTQLVAHFLLPAVDGFSPNVNVMLFSGHKDIKGFAEVTSKEFEEMGAKITAEKKPNETSWVIDYVATQNTTQLHFYARAEFKAGRIYLATATCPSELWEKHGAALKACVDSLKLK